MGRLGKLPYHVMSKEAQDTQEPAKTTPFTEFGENMA